MIARSPSARARRAAQVLGGRAQERRDLLPAIAGLGAGGHAKDTSSYGPRAIAAVAAAVGWNHLVYGSDRPVIDPARQPLGGPGLVLDDLGAARLFAPQEVLA